MAEIVKSEPLGDGITLDYWDNGRIQARNADGVFVAHPANYTPPAAMADIKAGRTKRQSKPVLAEVQALIDALPEELTEDPRERWIIEHLASSLVVGGTGTASVARELILRLGLPASQAMRRPAEGEKCSTCGRVYWKDNSTVPADLLRDLLGDLRAVQAEKAASVKVEREQESEAETPRNHGEVV